MEQKEANISNVNNLVYPTADLEENTYSAIANQFDVKTISQNQRSRILTINIVPFSKIQMITVNYSLCNKKSPADVLAIFNSDPCFGYKFFKL